MVEHRGGEAGCQYMNWGGATHGLGHHHVGVERMGVSALINDAFWHEDMTLAVHILLIKWGMKSETLLRIQLVLAQRLIM